MRSRLSCAALLIAAILVGGAGEATALVTNGSPAPEIAAGAWINSQPLTMQGLRGRVVLIDFWTFG